MAPPHLRKVALAVLVVAVGLALRVFLLRSGFGDLNGDEAYAGLQSLGVLRDGRFPVVIDGNVYSAVIEAYLFSPVLVFAGGSVVVLKMLFVGMWGVAAVATRGAARRLIDRRAAALAGALIWLAPGAMMVLSTRAYVCYGLGLAVAAGTVWATAVVADQPTPAPRASAAVGFLAGLGFYIHPMFITVLIPVVSVAALVHRRQLRRWWLPAVAAAFAANVPFIGWNAANGWPSLQSQLYPPGSYLDRLTGFITGLLPRGFGLRTFDGRWVFGKPLGVLVYAVIIGAVVYGCVVLVRGDRRPSRWIVPVALISCLPLMAMLPHLIYVLDGRYTILPLPFVAIAVSAAASSVVRLAEGSSREGSARAARRATAALVGVAALWVAVTTVPFMQRQQAFDRVHANAWQDAVINRLDEVGIDRVAGAYWLVLPIEYRSDQAIRTAVAGNPYVIRFPLSQRLVEQTPPEQVAFLFAPGTPDPVWFYLPVDEYRQEDLGGVILYLPPAAEG